MKKLLVLSITLSLLGCAEETQESPLPDMDLGTDADITDTTDASSNNITPERGTLPRIIDDASCDVDFVQPSLNEWAHAHDAILVGTVDRIEAFTDVVLEGVNGYPPLPSIDVCNTDLVPGLVIHLKDVETLIGTPTDNEVSVVIGTGVSSSWIPNPSYNQTTGEASTTLLPGDTLGIPVALDHTYNVLAPYDTPLFEVDAEEKIHFQAEPDCNMVPAEDLDGITLDELRKLVATAAEATVDPDWRKPRGDDPNESTNWVATVCKPR